MPDAKRNALPGAVRTSTAALALGCALLALVALADLAVRAALRSEIRWDTFAYHVPFDPLRGGLPVPYEMNDTVSGDEGRRRDSQTVMRDTGSRE